MYCELITLLILTMYGFLLSALILVVTHNTDCFLTTFSYYIHTELQLAALLGKTLLEKNAELENKLLKLQDFAEETVADNEVLHYIYSHCTLPNVPNTLFIVY